ncbi:carbonic anhydrase [Nocardioides sp. GY 10127]|uniref:beta-class carbonic anhydrase n=1 Tax=Nocardioides sp. GY 10127 TaxID=2569762 RepID=UPI0010A81E6A|nr:carbonic anhydrase [Nocardioides sp. GY 10127]TIC85408.1 carbonic anhydrase [Nocardioides sp. GY 10127]
MSTPSSPQGFEDLLEANRTYASTFTSGGFDGIAKAGVALVTCMDSRIEPLRLVGLELGDAKIFRNPGARVTDAALEAIVLGTHLLNVSRVMVIPHTRCAMASSSEEAIRERVSESIGSDATWHPFHVVTDQLAQLRLDVHRVRSHPLIPESVEVGGFIYNVDTGLLDQKF